MQGIADFQTIVSKGISQPLLEWKGIEATERLANSKNAKVGPCPAPRCLPSQPGLAGNVGRGL